MEASLFEQGIDLLIFGMGTVFVFLAVLVVATQGMSSLVQKYGRPDPVVASKKRRAPVAAAKATAEDDQQLISVISAAVHRYRSRD